MSVSIKQCFCVLPLDPKTVNMGEMGYDVMEKKAAVCNFWYREQDAIAAAEDFAAKNPKIAVLILKAERVIEAKKVELSTKEFKDSGELIPIRKEG